MWFEALWKWLASGAETPSGDLETNSSALYCCFRLCFFDNLKIPNYTKLGQTMECRAGGACEEQRPPHQVGGWEVVPTGKSISVLVVWRVRVYGSARDGAIRWKFVNCLAADLLAPGSGHPQSV